MILSLQQLQETFSLFLQKERHLQAPQELYEPVNYMMALGGKRIRPILCLIANQLFGGDLAKAMPAALAVEYFHNFTLVHDDIMDDAPLRRGKSTVFTKYDTNTAILSGDVILVKAYEYLQTVPPYCLAKVLQTFTQTAIEVCEGQQYDMNFETTLQVSVEEYIRMIELKTAVLIAASLKMGAVIGGASEQDLHNLYEFGRHVGIAFQLQDDYLDVYGQQEQFGKQVGGDIIQNKKTYLLLKALEKADGQQLEVLKSWLVRQPQNVMEKVNGVMAIYDELDIQSLTRSLMDDYYIKAFGYLNAVNVAPERKQPLLDVVSLLQYREN